MFEKASRLKLRFDTPQGALSVEDLWELPLTSARSASLDNIAIGLDRKLKHDTVSFVSDSEKPNPELTLAFEIVKHVIGVRKDENRKAAETKERAEQKQKMLAILSRKQDAELEGKSADELRALIDAM